MITEIKERRVRCTIGSIYLDAVVRDGIVARIDAPTNVTKEYYEIYLVFIKEVIEAIDQTS